MRRLDRACLLVASLLLGACQSPCEKLVNAVCERLQNRALCAVFRKDYKPADDAKQKVCDAKLPAAGTIATQLAACERLHYEVCVRLKHDGLCAEFQQKNPLNDEAILAGCEARLANVDASADDERRAAAIRQQLQNSEMFKKMLSAMVQGGDGGAPSVDGGTMARPAVGGGATGASGGDGGSSR